MSNQALRDEFFKNNMNFTIQVFYYPTNEVDIHKKVSKTHKMKFIITRETLFADIFEIALRFWDQIDNEINFELTTIYEAQIDLSQNIYSYMVFFQIPPGSLKAILKMKEKDSKELKKLQEEAIMNPSSTMKDTVYKPIMPMEVQKHVRFNVYEFFFRVFPLFKRYSDVERNKAIKKRKKELLNEFSDSHCIIYAIVLFMLIITITQLPDYVASGLFCEKVRNGFMVESAYESSRKIVLTKETFTDIIMFDDYYDWVLGVIDFVFPLDEDNDNEHDFSSRNQILGGLMIQSYNTKTYNCDSDYPNPYDDEELTCSYPFYDAESKRTDDFVFSTGDLGVSPDAFSDTMVFSYVSKEKSFVTQTTSGRYGDYGVDGHFLYFPNGITSSEISSREWFYSAMQNAFYDNSVANVMRALIYNLDMDLFMHLEIWIEISSFGVLNPIEPDLISFRPGIYSSKVWIFYGDLINGVLCLLFALCFLMVTWREKDWKDRLRYAFFSLIGFMNSMIILLYITAVVLTAIEAANAPSHQEIQTALALDEFLDWSFLARVNHYSYVIRGLLIFFLLIRFIEVLRLEYFFNKLLDLYHKTIPLIIMFILMLGPYIASLSLIAHQQWGLKNMEFSSYGDAVQRLVQIVCGIYSFPWFNNEGNTASLVFLIILFVFTYFVTFTFTITLILFTNDRVQRHWGTVKLEEWKISELLSWFRLFGSSKKKKYDDDDDEPEPQPGDKQTPLLDNNKKQQKKGVNFDRGDDSSPKTPTDGNRLRNFEDKIEFPRIIQNAIREVDEIQANPNENGENILRKSDLFQDKEMQGNGDRKGEVASGDEDFLDSKLEKEDIIGGIYQENQKLSKFGMMARSESINADMNNLGALLANASYKELRGPSTDIMEEMKNEEEELLREKPEEELVGGNEGPEQREERNEEARRGIAKEEEKTEDDRRRIIEKPAGVMKKRKVIEEKEEDEVGLFQNPLHLKKKN